MLSDHKVQPHTPTLSPREMKAAVALAEAILPGSASTPGADERTVARTEQVLLQAGKPFALGFRAMVLTLDEGARLRTGRPFHDLSRAEQESVLRSWEKSPVFRAPLNVVSLAIKTAHFDSPNTYRAVGGELRSLIEPPIPRWESQIKPAPQWEDERDIDCDVVIVGTGPGGAVVGHELAARGLAVVLVEEGKRRRRKEYLGSLVHAHSQYFRNVITAGNSPVMLLMGKLVGGSSAVNGGTSLRLPSFIHREWCERFGTDDFSEERMAPYFDRVEAILQVSEPERRFIGPSADVIDRGARALGWRAGPIPRNAVGCEGEGFCDFGCASGARRSVDVAYLPGALERGAIVLSEARADRVILEGGRAVGIEAVGSDHRRFRIRGRAVVIAGGGVPTPLLLLKQGLANSSGQVGRNLTVHPSIGSGGHFDERIDPHRYIPQAYSVTEFLEDGISIVAAQPKLNVAHVWTPFAGARLMRGLESVPHLVSFGVMLREKTRGRVWFDVGGQPAVTYNLTPDDLATLHRGLMRSFEMLFEAGARRVYPALLGVDPIETRAGLAQFERRKLRASELSIVAYHPLGTVRMGQDPKTSVVGLDHETHDVPNLYVVDGSTVPGPTGVNPQLTIMAMATRAAERIASKL